MIIMPVIFYSLPGLTDHHIDSFNACFRCIRLTQDEILQILDDIRREGCDDNAICLPDIGAGKG
ncbi:Uncharacterised protein [Serratia quinivorans]|nr:Uncharacterised protein [Serratia quinivorans]CAI1041144.1 Uncharacterised protein [Serratia quinivorans]CAI1108981.1 Uncharacterised protein [Serratia quinivorans]CAI1157665.1 Uncharacterised protein [Serratia quinivorans]CAI1914131.1 Uncharacterised protein [Serratia quinivorans]